MRLKLLSRAIVAIAVTVATFTLCARATPSTAASAGSVRCTVSVSSEWTRGPTPKLRIEAFSDGPTCTKAIVVHVIRDNAGRVLYQQAYESQFIATLQEARTNAQMRVALREWTDTTGPNFPNATLPNWQTGADQPDSREFGFMPHEDITRVDYLAIRSGRAPIICHVQGIESLNCLVWRNNTLQPFGIQQFPG